MRKMILAACAAVFGLFCSVQAMAQDFSDVPNGYEAMTVGYIKSRMDNPRGAQVSFYGEPYPIYVDIGRYRDVPGWAVEVSVRSSLRSGRSGFADYTVIFLNGQPVALSEDDVDFVDA